MELILLKLINASAFYKDETTWIKGIKGKVKADELIKAVEKAGFTASKK